MHRPYDYHRSPLKISSIKHYDSLCTFVNSQKKPIHIYQKRSFFSFLGWGLESFYCRMENYSIASSLARGRIAYVQRKSVKETSPGKALSEVLGRSSSYRAINILTDKIKKLPSRIATEHRKIIANSDQRDRTFGTYKYDDSLRVWRMHTPHEYLRILPNS